MSFLDAVFSGARAVVKGLLDVGRDFVRDVLVDLDRTSIGKAAARVLNGFADKAFARAKDLAEEERELADKLRRDGRRSSADEDRLREIQEQRDKVRKAVEEKAAEEAAAEMRARADELAPHELDDDEVSFNSGIISNKVCTCGGVMTIRQGPLDAATNSRKFYWQCTDVSRRIPCKRIVFDPRRERATIVRPADAELDMPKPKRREEWSRTDVIGAAHGRLRQHLDEEDKKVICPHHVLPMRLMQRRDAGNRLLDSYEYVCLGVHPNGQACTHTERVLTMPQVSSILHRTEGKGIL